MPKYYFTLIYSALAERRLNTTPALRSSLVKRAGGGRGWECLQTEGREAPELAAGSPSQGAPRPPQRRSGAGLLDWLEEPPISGTSLPA